MACIVLGFCDLYLCKMFDSEIMTLKPLVVIWENEHFVMPVESPFVTFGILSETL